MHVVVFAPYAYKERYFETELELAQKHLDAGDRVTILTCEAKLPECDMKQGKPFMCVRCMGRGEFGLQLLKGSFARLPFYCLSDAEQQQLARLNTRLFDHHKLTSFHVENFDLGWAVLSSMVSIHRDPDLDLRRHAAQLDGLMRGAWSVYYSMRRHLREQRPDRVYVFNGRHAPMRAAFRACQAEGVECLLHERGHDYQHYELYQNALPHDRDYFHAQATAAWARAEGDPSREAIAKQWYTERVQGVEQTGVSFITSQVPDQMPANWDDSRRNVGIFISSENEFVAIGDSWQNPLYKNQQQGLDLILAALGQRAHDLHLYVRVHPNLLGVDNGQTRALARLRAPFLTVIPADDPVSTYQLMRRCEKVLTFGSTAGIEATYWGVPSILAGMSYYRELGATYNPSTHDELVSLLQADLSVCDRTGAMIYGYYQKTFGRPYEIYQPQDRYRGSFQGQTVRPTKASWAKARVVKLWWNATKHLRWDYRQRAA